MYIFRADGSKEIGMGHIMRCFSIADCLKSLGKETLFLVSPDSDLARIQALGIKCVQLKQEHSLGWSVGEALRVMENYPVEAVILDSYRVTPDTFRKLRNLAPLYYIDDLLLFDCEADAVINYNIEASEQDYLAAGYPDRRLYLGPDYFPLRQDMIPQAQRALPADVRQVLITTGSTDPYGISRLLLQWIDPSRYPDIRFHILLGAFYTAQYTEELKRFSVSAANVDFLPWGQDMKTLYEDTDLMVAPGSTMIYEALVFGVSCISYQFADNQSGQCLAMDQKGLVPYIGDFQREEPKLLSERTRSLFESCLAPERRRRQRSAGGYHFDGKGAMRIAQACVAKNRGGDILV